VSAQFLLCGIKHAAAGFTSTTFTPYTLEIEVKEVSNTATAQTIDPLFGPYTDSKTSLLVASGGY
jgi:hypothetical protein